MVELLAKSGVKNVETFHMDALKFTYCNDVKYILVDPSCTGSGKNYLFIYFLYFFVKKILIYLLNTQK